MPGGEAAVGRKSDPRLLTHGSTTAQRTAECSPPSTATPAGRAFYNFASLRRHQRGRSDEADIHPETVPGQRDLAPLTRAWRAAIRTTENRGNLPRLAYLDRSFLHDPYRVANVTS